MILQFYFNVVVTGCIRVCVCAHVCMYVCNHQCACAYRHMHVDLGQQIVGVGEEPTVSAFAQQTM